MIASVTAAGVHWRAGTIDSGLVQSWLPALMAGAVIGLTLGPVAPTWVLTTLFAVVAAGLALKMLAGDRLIIGADFLHRPGHRGRPGGGRRCGRWYLEHPHPDAVLIFHQTGDRRGCPFRPGHRNSGDCRVPADGPEYARPAVRCAGRCRPVLRCDAVAARALCRANGGPMVGKSARRFASALVCLLPRRNRSPSASEMMQLSLVMHLALGQSGRIVFSCWRSEGSDPIAH